jgi:hypothetical protein
MEKVPSLLGSVVWPLSKGIAAFIASGMVLGGAILWIFGDESGALWLYCLLFPIAFLVFIAALATRKVNQYLNQEARDENRKRN